MNKLPLSFYQNPDVVDVARSLLGKILMTQIDGVISGGYIVETEAYCGRNDKACHAYNGKRTKRNEVMYAEGGKAYVYLCYGIHSLFNVVTNVEGLADAVLIRGVYPCVNVEEIYARRGTTRKVKKAKLLDGPGKLTVGLGIETNHSAENLLGDSVWIENTNVKIKNEQMLITPRIGIDYAEEDALLPWRFVVKDFDGLY